MPVIITYIVLWRWCQSRGEKSKAGFDALYLQCPEEDGQVLPHQKLGFFEEIIHYSTCDLRMAPWVLWTVSSFCVSSHQGFGGGGGENAQQGSSGTGYYISSTSYWLLFRFLYQYLKTSSGTFSFSKKTPCFLPFQILSHCASSCTHRGNKLTPNKQLWHWVSLRVFLSAVLLIFKKQNFRMPPKPKLRWLRAEGRTENRNMKRGWENLPSLPPSPWSDAMGNSRWQPRTGRINSLNRSAADFLSTSCGHMDAPSL